MHCSLSGKVLKTKTQSVLCENFVSVYFDSYNKQSTHFPQVSNITCENMRNRGWWKDIYKTLARHEKNNILERKSIFCKVQAKMQGESALK